MLSNPSQYSEQWKNESEHLENHGIYQLLSKKTPKGDVLEFGCGVGNGTRYLSTDRNVLSLDSNEHLIEEAAKYLSSVGSNAKIHKCDFFDLTKDDKDVIDEFKPKVIAGWFIGSHGVDIFKRTTEEPNNLTKSKLYREKVEDIIVSHDVCLASVEYIHLVNRVALVAGFSEEEYSSAVKEDYDEHIFGKMGFEVSEVERIDWPREGSEFHYGSAPNRNLAEGETVPAIISIIARRVK